MRLTSSNCGTFCGADYAYDIFGNVNKTTIHTYSWDNEGDTVTIDSHSLTYDALSRRVEYGTGSSFTQYLYAPSDSTLSLGTASAQASPSLRIPMPGGGQAILGASGITDYRRPNYPLGGGVKFPGICVTELLRERATLGNLSFPHRNC